MSNVTNLNQFKEKKKINENFSNERVPLYVSHLTGKVTAGPKLRRPSTEDFGDRIVRIKESLNKINILMDQLKKGHQGHQEEPLG